MKKDFTLVKKASSLKSRKVVLEPSKKTLDFIRNFAHNYNACSVSKGTYLTMSWN